MWKQARQSMIWIDSVSVRPKLKKVKNKKTRNPKRLNWGDKRLKREGLFNWGEMDMSCMQKNLFNRQLQAAHEPEFLSQHI